MGQPKAQFRRVQLQAFAVLWRQQLAADRAALQCPRHQRPAQRCVRLHHVRGGCGQRERGQRLQRLRAQDRAIRPHGTGRNQLLVICQIQHSGTCIGRDHGFAQQARQQAVKMFFGGHRHAQLQKPPDGALHALHRNGQIVAFFDQMGNLNRLAKIKPLNRLDVSHQTAQWLRYGARQHPGQRHGQRNNQQRGNCRPCQLLPCASIELQLRNRHQQTHILGPLARHPHGSRAPDIAVGVTKLLQRQLLIGLKHMGQRGALQICQTRHGAAGAAAQQGFHAVMGQQLTAVIDQGQLGAGRKFIARQRSTQGGQIDICRNNRTTPPCRNGQRDADRAGGVKHIRPRLD